MAPDVRGVWPRPASQGRRIARLCVCLIVVLECVAATPSGSATREADLWPHSRGQVGSYSRSHLRGPRNLSEAFLWKWHHPGDRYRTVITGGAIFDASKNIYLTTEAGVWKFSPAGETLWFHYCKDMGTIPSAVSINEGRIFGCTQTGMFFSLNMTSGQEIWRAKHADRTPGDTHYVEAYKGIIVTGVDPDDSRDGGARRILGLNATSGARLWEFFPDVISWNFQAQFDSDGESFIFEDIFGRGYRVGAKDGRLIWKSGPDTFVPNSFTDGGALLDEDLGMVFTVASSQPGHLWMPDTPGMIYALNFKDGSLIWKQQTARIPNSWPVVGPLQKGAKPSVVIPEGKQGVMAPIMMLATFIPDKIKWALHRFSLWLGDYQMYFWGIGLQHLALPMPLDVEAFDAATGARQWKWEGPTHWRVACGGDEEGLEARATYGVRALCWPGPWSAPTIDSDGTVYVGAQNGDFIALWDGNGDGKIDDATEVSKFDTGASALHPGPALVPGLLAYPTCDGLFVFKAPS